MAEPSVRDINMADEPRLATTTYSVTVTPSRDPDRGAWDWVLHLKGVWTDGYEEDSVTIAKGQNDNRGYCVEFAREALVRHTSQPRETIELLVREEGDG